MDQPTALVTDIPVYTYAQESSVSDANPMGRTTLTVEDIVIDTLSMAPPAILVRQAFGSGGPEQKSELSGYSFDMEPIYGMGPRPPASTDYLLWAEAVAALAEDGIPVFLYGGTPRTRSEMEAAANMARIPGMRLFCDMSGNNGLAYHFISSYSVEIGLEPKPFVDSPFAILANGLLPSLTMWGYYYRHGRQLAYGPSYPVGTQDVFKASIVQFTGDPSSPHYYREAFAHAAREAGSLVARPRGSLRTPFGSVGNAVDANTN